MLADTTITCVTHSCTTAGAFCEITLFCLLNNVLSSRCWQFHCRVSVTQGQFCWREILCPENWFLSSQQIDQTLIIIKARNFFIFYSLYWFLLEGMNCNSLAIPWCLICPVLSPVCTLVCVHISNSCAAGMLWKASKTPVTETVR